MDDDGSKWHANKRIWFKVKHVTRAQRHKESLQSISRTAHLVDNSCNKRFKSLSSL